MDDASFSEDIRLWKRLQKGDRGGLSELFRKYYTPLLNFGLKLIPREDLIKDSIQELFFLIWQQRDRLSEVEYVRSYLYTSLRRTIFRQVEIQEVRNKRDLSYAEESYQEMISQEKLMMIDELEREQKDHLVKALRALTEREKEAVFLKFYGGLTTAEIAEVMEVNMQSVYNYIYRAIEALKDFLDA